MDSRNVIPAEQKNTLGIDWPGPQLNNELVKIYRSYLNFTIGRAPNCDWTGKTSELCGMCISVDVTSHFYFNFPLYRYGVSSVANSGATTGHGHRIRPSTITGPDLLYEKKVPPPAKTV